MAERIHVIGGGIAGLAAAVMAVDAGRAVTLYEAAPQAGGRCRSFEDATLAATLDNGSHLALSGNRALMGYLARIGSADSLHGPGQAEFAFRDLGTGESWTVRPNDGPVPWWMLRSDRRVPGSRIGDYLRALRLLWASPQMSVADVLSGAGVTWERLWRPLAIAALNTPPEQASARLFAAVLRETVFRGGAVCRPLVPRVSLSASFIDPALAHLAAAGAGIRFATRIDRLVFEDGRITGLVIDDTVLLVESGEKVVLAVPPDIAATLLPGLVPLDTHAIVNAHFRVDVPPGSPTMLGLIGGMAEWLFARPGTATSPGIVSVTVSAADRLLALPNAELGALLWADAARALGLTQEPPPPMRVVKTRKATFAASVTAGHRSSTRTEWSNLFLAGDWTQTGLPATLEGAVRSGFRAMDEVLRDT